MWWQVLFWFLLVPTLIILGIVYGTTKRLYKLFFILSTFTYVIFIAYIIDVFSLGRNWILGLLLFSALLMLFLGYRMANKQKAKRLPTLPLIGVLLAIMLILIILGSLGQATRSVEQVSSITYEQALDGVPIATITYDNAWILPTVVPDVFYTACWYDSTTDETGYEPLFVSVDGQEYVNQETPFPEVEAHSILTRRVILGSSSVKPALDSTRKIDTTSYKQYDEILIFAGANSVDCQNHGDATLSFSIPLRDANETLPPQ